jgi:hypothetical protein
MGDFTEELRAQAIRYRQAAETGPRRERAFRLTYAFCLEQRANILEQTGQLHQQGIAEGR